MEPTSVAGVGEPARDTQEIEAALVLLAEERKLLSGMAEAYGRELLRPAMKWQKATLSERQELQTLIFPDGLTWHRDFGFFSNFKHPNTLLWQDLLEAIHSTCTVGVPDGI